VSKAIRQKGKDKVSKSDKSLAGIAEDLFEAQTDAIKRAKAGRERNKDDESNRTQVLANWNPELANPSSTVDLLICELRNLA
jgi:hypothetical protein